MTKPFYQILEKLLPSQFLRFDSKLSPHGFYNMSQANSRELNGGLVGIEDLNNYKVFMPWIFRILTVPQALITCCENNLDSEFIYYFPFNYLPQIYSDTAWGLSDPKIVNFYKRCWSNGWYIKDLNGNPVFAPGETLAQLALWNTDMHDSYLEMIGYILDSARSNGIIHGLMLDNCWGYWNNVAGRYFGQSWTAGQAKVSLYGDGKETSKEAWDQKHYWGQLTLTERIRSLLTEKLGENSYLLFNGWLGEGYYHIFNGRQFEEWTPNGEGLEPNTGGFLNPWGLLTQENNFTAYNEKFNFVKISWDSPLNQVNLQGQVISFQNKVLYLMAAVMMSDYTGLSFVCNNPPLIAPSVYRFKPRVEVWPSPDAMFANLRKAVGTPSASPVGLNGIWTREYSKCRVTCDTIQHLGLIEF